MSRKRVIKNKKVALPVLNPDAAGIDIGATKIYGIFRTFGVLTHSCYKRMGATGGGMSRARSSSTPARPYIHTSRRINFHPRAHCCNRARHAVQDASTDVYDNPQTILAGTNYLIL
jgi:hypothetical protein